MNFDAMMISAILATIIALAIFKLLFYLAKKGLVGLDTKRRKCCPNCGGTEVYDSDPIPYTQMVCCNCKALLNLEFGGLAVVMDDATKRFPEIASWWA